MIDSMARAVAWRRHAAVGAMESVIKTGASRITACRILLLDPMTAPLHSLTRAIPVASAQRALSWWAWR